MTQNEPQINQDGTLGLSWSHLGEQWVPKEIPIPILAPTSSLIENGSRNLEMKHQSINASKKGGRRHWRSHQIRRPLALRQAGTACQMHVQSS